ncbi:MAG TPA: hypothetical protein PKZ53_22750, partial [Acidobacteriota bacterium]|nr:hypothetical protein [Acidobacteriota bacterium]HNJ43323.1 hypothetical protein [Acidobacteriota bacterium]
MARLDVASKALHYQVLPEEGQEEGGGKPVTGATNNTVWSFRRPVVIVELRQVGYGLLETWKPRNPTLAAATIVPAAEMPCRHAKVLTCGDA